MTSAAKGINSGPEKTPFLKNQVKTILVERKRVPHLPLLVL